MTQRGALALALVTLLALGSASASLVWFRWSDTELPAVATPPTNVDPEPGEVAIIHVDRWAPFPVGGSVLGLASQADAILIVRLEAEPEYAVVGSTRWTIYPFHVLQIVSGPGNGGTVKIGRLGGRRTWEDGFPRPGLGEEFLVLLKWWPPLHAYVELYGPEGCFRVVNGRVHPVGHLSPSLLGREVTALVTDLREGLAAVP